MIEKIVKQCKQLRLKTVLHNLEQVLEQANDQKMYRYCRWSSSAIFALEILHYIRKGPIHPRSQWIAVAPLFNNQYPTR